MQILANSNLFLYSKQPCFHVCRCLIDIKSSFIHISEDLLRAVVARNDDEAVVLAYVEHVERITEGLGLVELRVAQGCGAAAVGAALCLLLQEGGCLLFCRCSIDGGCDGAAAEQQGSHHGKHFLSH